MNHDDTKQATPTPEPGVKLGARMERETFGEMMRQVNNGRSYNDGLRVYVSSSDRVYKGPIIYETEGHMVQQIGKNTAIMHDRSLVQGQLSDHPRTQYEIAYDKSSAKLAVIPFEKTNQDVMQKKLLSVVEKMPQKEQAKAAEYINKAFSLLAAQTTQKAAQSQAAPQQQPAAQAQR